MDRSSFKWLLIHIVISYMTLKDWFGIAAVPSIKDMARNGNEAKNVSLVGAGYHRCIQR